MIHIAILLLILLYPISTAAHAVDYRIVETQATTLEISYAGGQAFSLASYEIFGPNDTKPFQLGQSDQLGRITFRPDRAGEWTIKVFSDDGHGVQAVINITDDLSPTQSSNHPLRKRVTGVLTGLFLIAGGALVARRFLDRRL